jgi:hypothetical protein
MTAEDIGVHGRTWQNTLSSYMRALTHRRRSVEIVHCFGVLSLSVHHQPVSKRVSKGVMYSKMEQKWNIGQQMQMQQEGHHDKHNQSPETKSIQQQRTRSHSNHTHTNTTQLARTRTSNPGSAIGTLSIPLSSNDDRPSAAISASIVAALKCIDKFSISRSSTIGGGGGGGN